MKYVNKTSLVTVALALAAVWAINKYDSDILSGNRSFF